MSRERAPLTSCPPACRSPAAAQRRHVGPDHDRAFCSAFTAFSSSEMRASISGSSDAVFTVAALMVCTNDKPVRSEEHTSELQSLMRNSYAVFCLKKQKELHNLSKTNICHQTRMQK